MRKTKKKDTPTCKSNIYIVGHVDCTAATIAPTSREARIRMGGGGYQFLYTEYLEARTLDTQPSLVFLQEERFLCVPLHTVGGFAHRRYRTRGAGKKRVKT